MAYEKNPDELGALWLKSGSKGEYMTGEINGVAVFCTPTKSSNPKAPAWRVMKSKPRTETATDQRPIVGRVPQDDWQASPVTDEDIAF